MTAIFPDRANGMYDMLAGQSETRCHTGLTGVHDTDQLPGCQQHRTCLGVNRCIHTGADHRPWIGRVDNGIHLHMGNVISDDFKGHQDSSPSSGILNACESQSVDSSCFSVHRIPYQASKYNKKLKEHRDIAPGAPVLLVIFQY